MTKDKAIQSILILIKEMPNLDDSNPIIHGVNLLLDEVRINILLEGFSFNRTTQKVPFTLPKDISEYSVLVFLDNKGKQIHRNQFALYAGNTLRGLLDLSFERIPTLCQYWIIKRVARLHAEQNFMDRELRHCLWQAEEQARLMFLRKEYHHLSLNPNIIS